ncbi:MAG: TIM barrel protein [Pseudomonadota bacterium]
MTEIRFSANLGLLWRDLPFIERMQAAGANGFKAVEFHDHAQREDLAEVKSALDAHNLELVSLNVKMSGCFGKAAIPGSQNLAQADILEAVNAADVLGAEAIHVLSGCTQESSALEVFVDNLAFALENTDKTILIEPIANIPGYFLNSLSFAVDIIERISNPQLKIMFDCFHVRHKHQDLIAEFNGIRNLIGHVQIASYPNRNEPIDGKICYSRLIPEMIDAGYEGRFGCEYFSTSSVEDGLGWMKQFR